MSYRHIPPAGQEMRDFLRDIVDRLEKIERGGAIRGQVSFDSRIQIGDVQISVTDAGGGHRNLTFLNAVNGATYTITL